MTLPNELHPGFLASAGGSGDLGDTIEQSLRNTGTAQFYRSSFPIPSQWTASFWFKFGRGYQSTGGGGYAFSWHFSGTSYVICGLGIGYPASYTGSSSNGNCLVVCVNGLSTWSDINTSYQIRDPSAWYHHTIVSNAGTLTWYVNGVNIGNVTGVKTSGTSANFTIGGQAQSSSIQGYFADFHYIDGTNYAPTDFARTNEDGVWVPKTAEGITYGSNGFHLTFNSSQANGIGHDSSGQGNNFTTSGYDTADVRLYSKDLFSMTTGSGNWTTTTSKNWSSNTAATGFNGNLSDAVQVTTGDTWVWRPSYSLTATLVEVYPTNSSPNQKLYFNGTEVGGSYTGAAWNTVYTGSATTVNHIGGEFTGGGNGFYGIRVNGTVLVDNTYNDVDFFDTPTSNYATLNAALGPINQTLSNTNLSGTGNSTKTSLTTQLPNYKYYWEGTGSNYYHGISEINAVRDTYLGNRSDEVGWFRDGTFWVGASNVGTFGPSFTTTDIAMLAYDPASGKLWVGINGTWHGSGDPANGTNPAYTVGASIRETMVPASNVSANTVSYNFGQMPFIYTVPAGFKALQTNNLLKSTIKNGKEHCDSVTYNGSSSDVAVTSLQFQPDFVWMKSRSNGSSHELADSVRGIDRLISVDDAGNESTTSDTLKSFDSNGFTLGTGQSNINFNGRTYVAWCWKAGTSFTPSQTGGLTNLSGSKNTDAGFSIIAYTGSGSAGTVGHGLDEAPEFVVATNRTDGGGFSVYHIAAGAASVMNLNNTVGQFSATHFNSTAPSNSVVSLGVHNNTNETGKNHIMYCWHSVKGYSQISNYYGTSDADGPFIYTGFKVNWLLIKNTGGTGGGWGLYDAARFPNNPVDGQLYANSGTDEGSFTARPVDFLANGFKIRDSNSNLNQSGQNYAYMAFAESPFGGQNVPPATGR